MNDRKLVGTVAMALGCFALAMAIMGGGEVEARGARRGALGISGTPLPGLGMRVNAVFPFSPAARLGLEPGDLIQAVNNIPADSSRHYFRALASSGGVVTLLVRDVRSGGSRVYAGVPLEPPAILGAPMADPADDRVELEPAPVPAPPARNPGAHAGIVIRSR